MAWLNLRADIEGMFAELDGYEGLVVALERARASHLAYLKQWTKQKRDDPCWVARQRANSLAWHERKRRDPAWVNAQKAYFRAWYQANKAKVKVKAQTLSADRKARKAEATKRWKKKKAQSDPAWVAKEKRKKKRGASP